MMPIATVLTSPEITIDANGYPDRAVLTEYAIVQVTTDQSVPPTDDQRMKCR
jgi:hypothetical protein